MKNKIEKPRRVIVEITDRCNFNCKHFDNICKEKIQSITITGGEPLLYKDLFELLKIVKIRKTKLCLDTNASLINETNIKLIEKYFKKIRVSHYGISRSWHANTQTNGFNEQKFLDTLKLLCDSKLKVQVKIPLFGNNVKNLFKILDGLKPYNIGEIVLIPIIPVGKGAKLNGLIGGKEAKRLIKQYDDKDRNIKVFRWAKGKHFLIRSNGNVVLSPPIKKEETILGNALDRTISELWEMVPDRFKEINENMTSDIK